MLVVTNKVTEGKDIVGVLDLVKRTGRSLIVFSEDMQQEPLSTMVYNHQKNNLQCCAVNVPWMADMQKEFLMDIAVQTGATPILRSASSKEKVLPAPLGPHMPITSGTCPGIAPEPASTLRA